MARFFNSTDGAHRTQSGAANLDHVVRLVAFLVLIGLAVWLLVQGYTVPAVVSFVTVVGGAAVALAVRLTSRPRDDTPKSIEDGPLRDRCPHCGTATPATEELPAVRHEHPSETHKPISGRCATCGDGSVPGGERQIDAV